METIDRVHKEYAAKAATWKQYRDLYLGGKALKANAHSYLIRRQMEPADVYNERLSRVFYENYLGSIIDWYGATLFRREPMVTVEGENEPGRRFVSEFVDDCDRRGSSLSEFYRRRLIETLVCGESYMLVDFPRPAGKAGTRAEEEAAGLSRAYLTECSPEQVVNWHRDDQGNYEWVVVKMETERPRGPLEPETGTETRWYHYDKSNFKTYRRIESGTGQGEIQLVDSGPHALAGQKRVPLFRVGVPEGFWLANKAGLLQLEHFNKSNALSWALTVGLFAMPVVYTDREWNQIMGESYYIQLGPEDRFGWTEPEGHVFQIAADNLRRLQEEIYRVCYLLSQAGNANSSRSLQSGLSKQRDFSITQEVLRAYGDLVKDSMKAVLRAIVEARGDDLSVDVSGLDDFDIGDFAADLSEAKALLELGIESPTLRRQVLKKLAFKYLCDVRQEVKDQIASEIDEALSA